MRYLIDQKTSVHWGWEPKSPTFKPEYNERYDLDGFEGESFAGYDFVASEELMEAIQNLPEEQKEVIILFYFEDLQTKEIAQDLNISENTVKSRIRLAKEKLSGCLTDKNV